MPSKKNGGQPPYPSQFDPSQGERQMQIDTTEALSGADWQEAIASLAAMHDQSLQPDIRVHNAVISACRRGTLELSF